MNIPEDNQLPDQPLYDQKSYSLYLQNKSFLGKLYRKYLLYPKLNSFLTGRVLDYGCGVGDFLAYRAGTVGVDINPHTVKYCQSNNLPANLIQDSKVLPFENAEFQSIVLDNVLEHISENDVDEVITEILRVLAPQGRLLIGVPGKKGYASDPDHKCFYSEGSLIHLMKKFGCDNTEKFYMPFHMPWLDTRLSQYCLYAVFVNNAQ